jgi:WD40 repeat protein
MDEMNNEGIVGSSNGCFSYINFNEKMVIKLVTKASKYQDKIKISKFDSSNMFLTSSHKQVKIWATHTVDQVM